MRTFLSFMLCAFFSVASTFGTGAAAPATPPSPAAKPLRHLVFDYSIASDERDEEHYSGLGVPTAAGAPGVDTRRTTDTDNGTITVDVMSATTDGGLVVRISEQSSVDRSRFVGPFSCAVYGDTNVACKAQTATSAIDIKMLSVLRLLGRNFVDANRIDANNHWRTQTGADTGVTVTGDYTITSNDNGIAKIVEALQIHNQNAIRLDEKIDGTIAYDISMTVPRAIHEDMTTHPDTDRTLHRTVDITLKSDSLATK